MTAPTSLPAFMGHRGAAALAPENTLAGLAAAREAGCRWVEVDVMLSRDGVPVLHHDHVLKRSAGDRRKLAALAFAELRALDVGRWFGPEFAGARIPSLREALERMLALDLTPNLEIKPVPGREADTTAALIAVVREVWPANRPPPLLSSFRVRALEVAQNSAPELPRGLIAARPPRSWRHRMEALGCVSLHVSRRYVTLERIEAVRSAGYDMAIYTVNDPVEAVTFHRWGANCIITDAPDAVGAALARALPPVAEGVRRPV